MPFFTVEVDNSTVTFDTVRSILSTKFEFKSVVVELDSGASWAFFFEEETEVIIVGSTIAITNNYTGFVQIAFLGVDASTYDVYKRFAGNYPTSGTIDYTFNENDVEYSLIWNTADESKDLLMFALPHH